MQPSTSTPPQPTSSRNLYTQQNCQSERAKFGSRLNFALGPVAAGMILDLMDLSTFGPMGLFLGAPVGGLAGYWMGTALRLDRWGVLFCTILGGIYCTIPFTEVVPLATLVGACVRYQTLPDDDPFETTIHSETCEPEAGSSRATA